MAKKTTPVLFSFAQEVSKIDVELSWLALNWNSFPLHPSWIYSVQVLIYSSVSASINNMKSDLQIWMSLKSFILHAVKCIYCLSFLTAASHCLLCFIRDAPRKNIDSLNMSRGGNTKCFRVSFKSLAQYSLHKSDLLLNI